jgi:hypothetical protein
MMVKHAKREKLAKENRDFAIEVAKDKKEKLEMKR